MVIKRNKKEYSDFLQKILDAKDRDLLLDELIEEVDVNIERQREHWQKRRKENKQRLKELEGKDIVGKSVSDYQEEVSLKIQLEDRFNPLFGELKEQYGHLRSLEMIRRLKNSIYSLNKQTTALTKGLIALTFVLIGIGVLQIILYLLKLPLSK